MWRELINDIEQPLKKILGDLESIPPVRNKERILNSILVNKKLHHSRTSYINFLKNLVVSGKQREAANNLSLAACLSENLIHDIDNRLDNHSFGTLDACFLQAYQLPIVLHTLKFFSENSTKMPLKSSFTLKKVSEKVLFQTSNFLNEITKMPYYEKVILEPSNMERKKDSLLTIMDIVAGQSRYFAFLVFAPLRETGQINNSQYDSLIELSVNVHKIDKLHKDMEDFRVDTEAQRINLYKKFKDPQVFSTEQLSMLVKDILHQCKTKSSIFCADTGINEFLLYWETKANELLS